MNVVAITRTLGLLFTLFSATLVPPLAVSAIYGDGEFVHFAVTWCAAITIGASLWLPFYKKPVEIRNREGFVIVALTWVAISLFGSVPFLIVLDMSFADALFESVSGFTTTGATVLVGLDELPKSILLYRQITQWVGGIGVVILAVAALPTLRVGGMQLYRAELPGPLKDEKLTPRIARTARQLSVIYGVVTGACALCFWMAGMQPFDAVAHSMSTVSTGGYSPHDASIAFFDNRAIEAVATLFSLIGGINFSVHFIAWRALHLSVYGRDGQTRTFVLIIVALIAVVAVTLHLTGTYLNPLAALWYATFEVVTLITTTGFGIADFSSWPLGLPVLLMYAGFVGGSAGSTSGGIKVVRFMVLAKQMSSQLKMLVHPRGLMPIKINGRVVPETTISSVWAFCAIYVIVFVVLFLVSMSSGLDQVTAFGAVATCLNNVGPGLGAVASNFVPVGDFGTIVLAFAMLLGRLEIFTFLVLLNPALWRG